MARYATFPGRSRADVDFCLKCRWHGILKDWVICDYTLAENHHMRGCRAGVGCDKFEPKDSQTRSDKGKPRIRRPETKPEKPPEAKKEAPSMRERARKGGQAAAKARAENMVPWDPAPEREALLKKIGWVRIAEMAGLSDSNLRYSRRYKRIRRDAAEKIYEALGVDVTGGALEGNHDT